MAHLSLLFIISCLIGIQALEVPQFFDGNTLYNLNPGQSVRFTFQDEVNSIAANYSDTLAPPSFCKLYPPTTTLDGPTAYRISTVDTISDFIIVNNEIYVLTNNLMLMKLEILTKNEFGNKVQYTVIRDRTFALQEQYPNFTETTCKFIKYRRIAERVLMTCNEDILMFATHAIHTLAMMKNFHFGDVKKVEMEFNILIAIRKSGNADIYDFTNIQGPFLIQSVSPSFVGFNFLDIVDAYYYPSAFPLNDGVVVFLDKINGVFSVKIAGARTAALIPDSLIHEPNSIGMAISGTTLLMISKEEKNVRTTYKLKEYFLTREGTRGAKLNQFFTTEEPLTGVYMTDVSHDAIVLTPRSQYLYRYSIPKGILPSPFSESPLLNKRNIFKMATTDALEGDTSDITVGADLTTIYVWKIRNVAPYLVCRSSEQTPADFYKFALFFYRENCRPGVEFCSYRKDISLVLRPTLVEKMTSAVGGGTTSLILLIIFAVILVVFVLMCGLIIKYRREIQKKVDEFKQSREMRYNEINPDKSGLDKTAMGQRNVTTFEIEENQPQTTDQGNPQK